MTSKSIRPRQAPLRPSSIDWEPEPYQIEGVKFLLDNAAAGLFLKPGLRKTSIVLAALKVLKRDGMFRRALVVAPVRVAYSVWPAEVAKWTDFCGLRVEVLHGPKKDQALLRDADIYLVNPEGLSWLLGASKERIMRRKGRRIEFDQSLVGQAGISIKSEVRYDLAKLHALGADTLVVDEASKFRKPGTDRFDALKGVLETFERRYILTGSPAPKWLLDLFGVMYLVDLGRSLGAYITHYRRQFFMPAGWGGYSWVPQLGAEKAIHEAIAPSVFSLKAKDYVRMPKLVEVPVQVELPPAARKLYDALEEEFFAELDDGTPIVVANAGVASIKCRQVASGGLWLQQQVDDDGRAVGKREWRKVHDAKTEAVRDIIDELCGEPAIVAYDFGHDLERLRAEFGEDTPYIGGGVTAKRSDAIVTAWNRNELPLLLAHPSAVAHGLNAQEGGAYNIVLHSLNPDYELYEQLVSRLVRSGNAAARVFVHLVAAKDTVDQATLALLRKKEATQEALMEALNEYSVARRGRGITRKPRPQSPRPEG